MDRSLLEKKALAELRQIAAALDLTGVQRMKKADLVSLILDEAAKANGSSPDAAGDDDAGEAAEEAGEAEASASSTGDDASGEDGDERGGSRDRGQSGDDRGGRNKQRRRKNRGNDGGGQGDDDAEVREGVLDLLPEGYGFMRCTGYLSGARDVYVSQSYVRRFNLRRGDRVSGPIRSNNRGNDKYPALARVETIEGLTVEEHLDAPRRDFRDLTPIFPERRFDLATEDDSAAGMRLVDLLAPIGMGQRGLVVGPPRSGKTTLVTQVAAAIEANHPDAHVMVLLVDERPEEVTEVDRLIDGEVVATTFDAPAEDHTQVAELVVERARRLVERGRDVVVLLDSLTQLARAYDAAAASSGRSLPSGVDAGALHPAKRFFAAARNVEEGGSLTIVATASVETGVADEAIVEAFDGTATMELRLDRALEQKRLFPAVDVQVSGTLREERLRDADELEAVWSLRRALTERESADALQVLLDAVADTDDNAALLARAAKGELTG